MPRFYILIICLLIIGDEALAESSSKKLPEFRGGKTGFTRLAAESTGIRFTNFVTDIRSITNRNLLSGSGVAAGDVDGDGLCDLYFCALDGNNVLYRNLGNWKFEDITEKAGVGCPGEDSTGAVLADVDGDGDLDLLVTGLGAGARLFLNDGKGKFTEATETAGLSSKKGSTSMALADIDGDGDLDLYVVNYRPTSLKDTPEAKFQVEYIRGQPTITRFNGEPTSRPDLTNRFILSPTGQVLELGESDDLFINDGKGKFTAVSFLDGRFLDEDGKKLKSPPFDWGLAAMFYDFNEDGAPDLYVCNDLFSPDRIWLNDGHGNFRAIARTAIRCTSTFSMGVDFADINRDGHPDFFVTDMFSRDHVRRQVQVGEMTPFFSPVGLIDNQLQKSQNTLQLNRGDGTFAEIGCLSGVEASEWSWGPIFLDVDLDGWEDILICNGNQYDVQNADAAEQIEGLKAAKKLNHQEILRLMKLFPTLRSHKMIFRNQHDLTFKEMGKEWGFSELEISQGMALADLDNDGDLDVVINNFLTGAAIYRNESSAPRVAVRLKGLPPNTRGVGAKIRFTGGPVTQSQEMLGGARYLSCDDSMRVFAAGEKFTKGSIEVKWRSGKVSTLSGIEANRIYEIDETTAQVTTKPKEEQKEPWFEDVSELLNHSHTDEMFDDFQRQPLLPYRLSQLGPGVTWTDIDGDGWEDIIIPSGRGGKLALFKNNQKGGFSNVVEQFLQRNVARDQTTILGWGPLLLAGSANYEDGTTNGGAIRIYDLQRRAAGESLLGPNSSTGPMAMADVDGDGTLDLFVGGRGIAGRYPEPATSTLYKNEGNRFTVKQRFEKLGLISGAVFSDLDLDGDPDLILACHWGPIRMFRNDHGHFVETTEAMGLSKFTGLWNGVATGDFDNDGRPDIIASNWGLNTRWSASTENPLKLYSADFDGNGVLDTILTTFDPILKKEVPVQTMKIVGMSIPVVHEKMRTFAAYANASASEIFGEKLKSAPVLEVNTLRSMLFLNRGDHFEARDLPTEAQFAVAFGTGVGDLDGDGNEDVFLAQNFFEMDPEMPRSDAGVGLILKGDGKGNFHTVPVTESGIRVYGEGRGCALADYDHDGRVDLLIGQNGSATKLFRNKTAQVGVRIKVQGLQNNGSGVGATVRVNGGPLMEVQAGSGYWSCNAPELIAPGNIESLKAHVRTPSGKESDVIIPANVREITIGPNGEIISHTP